MITEILLIGLSFLLVAVGVAGVLLPFLPGVPVAWLGMLLFGYVTEFALISWKILFIFLGLTILTMILDGIAPIIGAKKFQASRYGIIGSGAGLIFGILIFGPVGIIIGPFLGALIGELFLGRTEEAALRSAKGTLIGFLAGSAVKLALIVVMLGYLIYALY